MTRHNPRSSSEVIARRARRGFSLIEAAIVLGVVGLVVGGIWVAASAVNNSIKWQQTEEGLSHYFRLINENFNQVNVAGKPVNDLHDSFLIKMPLPAGWKIGGPWGIHPVDPYGHALYAQYNGMGSGSLYFGISAFGGNKVSPAYCMKYVMLIIRNFDKLNRRMSGHPNAACIANPTTTSCNCISPITGMGHYYNLNMR